MERGREVVLGRDTWIPGAHSSPLWGQQKEGGGRGLFSGWIHLLGEKKSAPVVSSWWSISVVSTDI